MKRNVVIGCVVVAVCAIVAMASLSTGSAVQAKPFTAIRKSTDNCELYGKLDVNTIQSLQGGNRVRFVLEEEKTGERITVLYDNPTIALTANFPAASHARAQGVYDSASGEFKAHALSTKCPSKYEKELDLATQDALKRWQQDSGLKPPPGGVLEPTQSNAGSSFKLRF